jgi:glycosyltransferase involved in cell wall biosynthesis
VRITVVITTYNRADALIAVLEGYLAQEDAGFDVVVADDGSTDETRRAVAEYAARSPFPLRHVWQEDLGFRAAAIRNRALAATTADYIVFTDGDCVPPPSFARSPSPGTSSPGTACCSRSASRSPCCRSACPYTGGVTGDGSPRGSSAT